MFRSILQNLVVRDGQIFKDDWIEAYMEVRLTNWTKNPGESTKVFFLM